MDIIINSDDLENEDIYDIEPENLVWLKDKNIYRASAQVTAHNKIPAGIYQFIDTRQDSFIKELKSDEDELFKFTSSETYPLLDELSKFWNSEEKYSSNNYLHKRGVLLSGAPGTGKTSAISLICEEHVKSGGVAFKITGVSNLISYISFIKHDFRVIEPDTPLITIIEDVNKYYDVEGELSNFMDGKDNINKHLIVLTSNDTSQLSDIFFRPSRIDLHIVYSAPDENTRREYFEFKKVESDKIESFVSLTKDMTLVELKEVYICTHIFDYSLEAAIEKVNAPYNKTNHLGKRKKSKG